MAATRQHKRGTLIKVGPINRGVSPHATIGITLRGRHLLYSLLLDGMTYVRSPRFVEGFRLEPFDAESVRGQAGVGQQEAEAFLWMNYCKWRAHCIVVKLGSTGRPMGVAVTRKLAEWLCRADEMRTLLVEVNLPLAKGRAAHRPADAIDRDDWFQEAAIQLDECVAAFDADRGFHFSTLYCNSLHNQRARLQLRASRRRDREAAIQFEATRRLQQRQREADTAGEHEAQDCVERLFRAGTLIGLTGMERTVVRLRHGLDCVEQLSASQVAKLVGRSVSEVCKLNASALVKLSARLKA